MKPDGMSLSGVRSPSSRPADYFHGGVPGLSVGSWILPPSETRTSHNLVDIAEKIAPAGSQRRDRVYLTTGIEGALFYASAYPDGAVYQVEPDLPIEHDGDWSGEPGYSVAAPRALIIRVVHQRVPVAIALKALGI